jgi:hypothetical protein
MLFEYLNQEITDKKAPIRIFTLGIGNGVSHSLIEGVARAGNGFSQAVAEGEKMDQKVVRMLKGALSPHINDYTLEVKYTAKKKTVDADEGDDDYEIIEKVADSLKVKLHLNEKSEKSMTVSIQSITTHETSTNHYQMKPISLFDTSINLDEEEPTVHDETGESRYAHLPKIAVPNIIQAPQHIPSLFAFNRTTVYLLFGPDAPQQTPRSVVLRGISVHGPLELEIPIQILDIPGETVHQLAAKKAIAELEQGRGWLRSAKDESGNLVKKVFESSFEDMVEREAVRLGVQFGVGGKWCSFVAVEKTKSTVDDNASDGWLDEADISKQAFASSKFTIFFSQRVACQRVTSTSKLLTRFTACFWSIGDMLPTQRVQASKQENLRNSLIPTVLGRRNCTLDAVRVSSELARGRGQRQFGRTLIE